MPGHIREFNRLDRILATIRSLKYGGIIRLKQLSEFFVSDCELLVTKSQWVPPEHFFKKHQIQDLTFD